MNYKEGKRLLEQKVEDFSTNKSVYLSHEFNETRTRKHFIDPLFQALGWDFEQTHLKMSQWDVLLEYSDHSTTKRPDYAFRINGELKFFVEAKAPHVHLTNKEPVFQAKRYAFSTNGKAPIVILTDFEEFRVINALKKPNIDLPLEGVLKQYDLTYDKYLTNWDLLYGHFSRDAVADGALEELKGKLTKKTKTLDREFLEEITQWREMLARNIALRNFDLSVDELNVSVQRILDRLIFIRNLEDRRIEPEGKLLSIAIEKPFEGSKPSKGFVYSKLVPLFRKLDRDYNGLLFKQHFSEKLVLDDNVLIHIIKHLSWPLSPYQFDVIEPEILGRIYEKFLGSKIRLTAGHHAKVEEKPEVRKAGGVYYTPQYIVDYIVKHTVGEKAKGKTPEEITDIKIVDPACGSGSFLLGAFEYLMNYHLDWYGKNRKKRLYKNDWYETADGEIRLSVRKKAEILKNNIYGVDIDREATEVATMSLYLKLLDEGFDKGQAMLFMKGHILPDMRNNIKCGNSLIGSDYFDGTNLSLFDDDEAVKKVNAFDWDVEFPGVFTNGGFDCVIGNPPYVRQEILGQEFKDYAKQKYETFAGMADLYTYFIERGVSVLNEGGLFSFIVANKWMRTKYGAKLRDFVSNKISIKQIIDFGELPVFKNAATFPAIVIFENRNPKSQKFTFAPINNLNFSSLYNEVKKIGFHLDDRSTTGQSWSLVRIEEVKIIDKIKKIGIPFGDYVNGKIFRGILSGYNKAFVIDTSTKEILLKKNPKSNTIIKPFVIGDDVRRFKLKDKKQYLITIPNGWTNKNKTGNAWNWLEENFLSISKHLKPFESPCTKRWDKGEFWWELRPCDYYDEMERSKIVWPEIALESRFTFEDDGKYLNKTCFFTPTNDFYLLGFLNSKLNWFFLKNLCSVLGDVNKRGRLLQQKIYIEQIPIRQINFKNKKDKAQHDKMVAYVDTMLELNKKLTKVKTEHEKTVIQRQIDATDRKIDKLVYELYDLTKEEIGIVEDSIASN